jgi:hypothetical protein
MQVFCVEVHLRHNNSSVIDSKIKGRNVCRVICNYKISDVSKGRLRGHVNM